MESSPLICTANQWTDFYMIRTFVMKEWNNSKPPWKHVFSNTIFVIIKIVHVKREQEALFTLHKKMKFSIKNFFSKCDQIHRFLPIWSHLLKKFIRIHWGLIFANVIRCSRLRVWLWDFNEFWNFLLYFKNPRSGIKTVSGFSIILILKGIMMF